MLCLLARDVTKAANSLNMNKRHFCLKSSQCTYMWRTNGREREQIKVDRRRKPTMARMKTFPRTYHR